MEPVKKTQLLRAVAVAMLTACGTSPPKEGLAASASVLAPTTGRWIWASADVANEWVAFRKTFTLSTAPSSAVTQIAVDSKYWLYVNGSLVTFEGGLKRGPTPADTYYDEQNLASYLHAGSNTIAILVWHFGKSASSHKDSGAGGLLFQSDIVLGANSTLRLNSDATWKAMRHPGYLDNRTEPQPNFRLPEWNVYYDATKAGAMANWTQPTFADSSWPLAVNKAAASATPWNALVKRPIPFFKYSSLLSYSNSAPATGRGTTPIAMNLPSNLQVTPYLQVDAPAGQIIGIQTDHYIDGNDATATGDASVRSTYVTTGGVQEFESLGWMSGTKVEYTIPASVKIKALKYRESGYDTSVTGAFTSNDAFFTKLWRKAATGTYLNMRDNYMDCPTRERAQWWGDAVNEQKQGFYAFDSNSYALGKKAISELLSWQKPTGELFSPVPAGVFADELSVQMLASVYSLRTYQLYTGDLSAVDWTYDRIKTYMNLWTFDSDGLVAHRAPLPWNWSDNVDAPESEDDLDRRLIDNAWYFLALDTTRKLALLTNHNADVASWQQKSNSISDNFERVFWNDTTQSYRSPAPGYNGDTDDRGNALAVVAGLVPSSKRFLLIDALRGHTHSSPFMELYALEALYLLGDAAGAEARMKSRYTAEVNDPGYTLWESWAVGSSRTDDHGWAGGPLYALSAYGAGVRPTAAGYGSYLVRPEVGGQSSINAAVPTVRGPITSAVTTGTNGLAFTVTSSAFTPAVVAVPRIGLFNPTINLDIRTVYSNEAFVAGAAPEVSYLGRDADYVYLQASPGRLDLSLTGSAGTSCASEGESCAFSGIMQVRYGAGTQYLFKVANGDYGAIPCTSEAFGGDPIYGVVKQCSYAPPVPDEGPPGYTLCAGEGTTCSFSGTADVVYGAYGNFSSGTFSNGVACGNGTFGDPIVGVPKHCYYSLPPPNNGWMMCSGEADTCTLPGTRRMAYGANTANGAMFHYKTETARASCNNASFGGDPIFGVAKACFYK